MTDRLLDCAVQKPRCNICFLSFFFVFVALLTFVVKESLHLHAAARVSDAEHGTGYDALKGRRAVSGTHQAPVGLIVQALEHLDCLPPAHAQLIIVPCHEVMDNHSELAASRQLSDQEKENISGSEVC